MLALAHPGLSFPPVALVPSMVNIPAAAWVWHWVFLGLRVSHPLLLVGTSPCTDPLTTGTETTGAQQVPLCPPLPVPSLGAPRGHGELVRGGVGVSWGQGGLWLIWGWN